MKHGRFFAVPKYLLQQRITGETQGKPLQGVGQIADQRVGNSIFVLLIEVLEFLYYGHTQRLQGSTYNGILEVGLGSIVRFDESVFERHELSIFLLLSMDGRYSICI